MRDYLRIGLLGLALIGVSKGLEVHEWGTFTVLSGQHGQQMNWYQPSDDLAKLPKFVASPLGSLKANNYALLRMETPVLYFYPQEEMEVEVKAQLVGGRITEAYPHSRDPFIQGDWKVRLFPPDDAENAALIPSIPNPDPLEPYAAAREVPEAWIVRQEPRVVEGQEPAPPQAEKFIFYRGSGQTGLGIQVLLEPEGILVLQNRDETSYPFSVALRVEGDRAAWSLLESLPARTSEGAGKLETNLPDDWQLLEDVEAQLVEVFEKRLAEEGLTEAEAKAMVKTWRATWFREPGLRVLSTIPRERVDALLPITITPQPKLLERVFVLRSEVIEPSKLESLDALLQLTSEPSAAERDQFSALELGRFRMGYLQAWQQRESLRISQRFSVLATHQ